MKTEKRISGIVKVALILAGLSFAAPAMAGDQVAPAGLNGATPGTQVQGRHFRHHKGQFKLVRACLAKQGLTPPAPINGQRPSFASLDEPTKNAMKSCFVEIRQDMRSCMANQGVSKSGLGLSPGSKVSWSQLDEQTKSAIKNARKVCRAQILTSFNGSAQGNGTPLNAAGATATN